MGIGLPIVEEDVEYVPTNYWRLMLAFPIITAGFQTLMLLFVYRQDTPKFLYLNGHKKECEELLDKIYTEETVKNEVKRKLKALTQSDAIREVTWDKLFGPMYKKAVIVVLCKQIDFLNCHSLAFLPAICRR